MAALSIRIDENLRKGAEQVFRSMGLSLASGVRSYLNYVNTERKMPFAPAADPWHAHNNSSHIPNEETLAAMAEPKREVSRAELREMMGLPNA